MRVQIEEHVHYLGKTLFLNVEGEKVHENVPEKPHYLGKILRFGLGYHYKSYSRVVYDFVILEKLFYCGFQHLLVELKLQLVVSQEDMPNHFDVVCDRLIELLEFLDWSCYDLVLHQFCQIMHCCDES